MTGHILITFVCLSFTLCLADSSSSGSTPLEDLCESYLFGTNDSDIPFEIQEMCSQSSVSDVVIATTFITPSTVSSNDLNIMEESSPHFITSVSYSSVSKLISQPSGLSSFEEDYLSTVSFPLDEVVSSFYLPLPTSLLDIESGASINVHDIESVVSTDVFTSSPLYTTFRDIVTATFSSDQSLLPAVNSLSIVKPSATIPATLDESPLSTSLYLLTDTLLDLLVDLSTDDVTSTEASGFIENSFFIISTSPTSDLVIPSRTISVDKDTSSFRDVFVPFTEEIPTESLGLIDGFSTFLAEPTLRTAELSTAMSDTPFSQISHLQTSSTFLQMSTSFVGDSTLSDLQLVSTTSVSPSPPLSGSIISEDILASSFNSQPDIEISSIDASESLMSSTDTRTVLLISSDFLFFTVSPTIDDVMGPELSIPTTVLDNSLSSIGSGELMTELGASTVSYSFFNALSSETVSLATTSTDLQAATAITLVSPTFSISSESVPYEASIAATNVFIDAGSSILIPFSSSTIEELAVSSSIIGTSNLQSLVMDSSTFSSSSSISASIFVPLTPSAEETITLQSETPATTIQSVSVTNDGISISSEDKMISSLFGSFTPSLTQKDVTVGLSTIPLSSVLQVSSHINNMASPTHSMGQTSSIITSSIFEMSKVISITSETLSPQFLLTPTTSFEFSLHFPKVVMTSFSSNGFSSIAVLSESSLASTISEAHTTLAETESPGIETTIRALVTPSNIVSSIGFTDSSSYLITRSSSNITSGLFSVSSSIVRRLTTSLQVSSEIIIPSSSEISARVPSSSITEEELSSSLIRVVLEISIPEYEDLINSASQAKRDLEIALFEAYVNALRDLGANKKRQTLNTEAAKITNVGERNDATGYVEVDFYIVAGNGPVQASLVVAILMRNQPSQIGGYELIEISVLHGQGTTSTSLVPNSIIIPVSVAGGVLLLLVIGFILAVIVGMKWKKIKRNDTVETVSIDVEALSYHRQESIAIQHGTPTIEKLTRRIRRTSDQRKGSTLALLASSSSGQTDAWQNNQLGNEPEESPAALFQKITHYSDIQPLPPLSKPFRLKFHSSSVAPSPSTSNQSKTSLVSDGGVRTVEAQKGPKNITMSSSPPKTSKSRERVKLHSRKVSSRGRQRELQHTDLEQIVIPNKKCSRDSEGDGGLGDVEPSSHSDGGEENKSPPHTSRPSTRRRNARRKLNSRGQAVPRATTDGYDTTDHKTSHPPPSRQSRKHRSGRNMRARPLTQSHFSSGNLARRTEHDARRELAWMSTGNGVQLISIQPMNVPSSSQIQPSWQALPQLPSIVPDQNYSREQLEQLLQIHQELERVEQGLHNQRGFVESSTDSLTRMREHHHSSSYSAELASQAFKQSGQDYYQQQPFTGSRWQTNQHALYSLPPPPVGHLLWTPQTGSHPQHQTQPLSPYQLSQLRNTSATNVFYPPQTLQHPFGAS